MFDISAFLHFGTVALTAGVSAVGVGIGEGLASSAAIEAINIQPSARGEITKTAIIGMALIETAAIIGITMAFMLLATTRSSPFYAGIAECGIAFAICLPGFFTGLISSYPAAQACFSIARQPFFSQRIMRFMLVTQSVIQTPLVSGFIIAMFIRAQAQFVNSLPQALQLLASGLCIGLGSIGPSIGLGHFSRTACASIGINRDAYARLFSFTLLSQAIIETSVIFALVISFLIMFSAPTTLTLLSSIMLLGAALSIGLGTLGPGISTGRVSSAACEQIAYKPELYISLSRMSMIAQGSIGTTTIFAFIVSIFLIFWR